MELKTYWIPESPKFPGIYAVRDYKAYIKTMTPNPWQAMRFNSQEECEKWCIENPVPVYVAVEHGFAGENNAGI